MLTVHNLADWSAKARLELDPGDLGAGLAELLADQPYEPPGSPADPMPVAPYGYRWFRLHGDDG